MMQLLVQYRKWLESALVRGHGRASPVDARREAERKEGATHVFGLQGKPTWSHSSRRCSNTISTRCTGLTSVPLVTENAQHVYVARIQWRQWNTRNWRSLFCVAMMVTRWPTASDSDQQLQYWQWEMQSKSVTKRFCHELDQDSLRSSWICQCYGSFLSILDKEVCIRP